MIRRNRRGIATVCGLAAALALAACSAQAPGAGAQAGAPKPAAAEGQTAPNNIDPNALNGTDGQVTADSAPTGVTAALVAKTIPKMGNVVQNGEGFTLYRFDKDGNKPAKSNCNDDCATTWPPLLSDEIPKLTGIDPALVGTVIRTDGKQQVTLGGWPLYTFAKDPGPGKWAGQAVGNTWFVVDPAGKKNLSCLPKGAVVPQAGEETKAGDTAAAPPAASNDTGGYSY